MGRRKPTRRDLLVVIGRLQGLIGDINANVWNDQDQHSLEAVDKAIKEAFSLCVESRGWDPPIGNRLGPWGNSNES